MQPCYGQPAVLPFLVSYEQESSPVTRERVIHHACSAQVMSMWIHGKALRWCQCNCTRQRQTHSGQELLCSWEGPVTASALCQPYWHTWCFVAQPPAPCSNSRMVQPSPREGCFSTFTRLYKHAEWTHRVLPATASG